MGEDVVLERIRVRVANFEKAGTWDGQFGKETELMQEMTHLLNLYDKQSEDLIECIEYIQRSEP